MLHRDMQVVVVGAGIAGLTAALLLSRVVRHVTLVERAAAPAEVGAGIMLQPNGLGILTGLGLVESVRRQGRVLTTMEIRNAHGRLLSTATMPDFGGGLDHYVAIVRRDLHATLLAAVEAETAISCLFGSPVTGVTREGQVQLAGSALMRADLIIGADGVSSAVRTSGCFTSSVSNRSTDYVRALVRGPAVDAFTDYWTPLGSFGIVPLRADLTYFWAAAYRGAAAAAVIRNDLPGLVAAWQAVLPEAAQRLGLVERMEDVLVNGVRRVCCRAWRDGRLVLIGDAAHAMAPNPGQGANSAMVDAVVLARELATGAPVEEALRRYEQRRRRTMTNLQRIAERLTLLNGLRSAAGVALRDGMLKTAARVPGLLEWQIRGAQQEDPTELQEWTAALMAG